MPKLSDGMEEGTVAKWLLPDGYPLKAGDEFVEIETDKSTVAHATEQEGILRTVVPEGTTCEVGSLIARVEPIEPDSDALARAEVEPSLPSAYVQESEEATSSPNHESSQTTQFFAPAAVPSATELGDGAQGESSSTPLSRKAAARHGVDLESVQGTGPGGRVLVHDVLAVAGIRSDGPQVPAVSKGGVAELASSPHPTTATCPFEGSDDACRRGETTLQPLSRVQRIIATRMADTKATVPDFQIECVVAMSDAVALRSQLRTLEGSEGSPTVNDLIIKACALALRHHPLANGSFTPDGFVLHEMVNVGFAVAVEGALIVPTVFNADIRSLGDIASESRRLAERARSGSATPDELAGGTFTVSNLGMFGVTGMVPIINPPQAAILGVGALRNELTRINGEVVDRIVATFTLSCDHRILYGSDAARFLAEIRQLLETPIQLFL